MKKILLVISIGLMLAACDNTSRFLDCIDGCSVKQGPQGEPGPQGPQGDAGQNGLSCTVSTVPNGSVISCEDGTTSAISDGTEIEEIKLCPSVLGGTFTEYLLRINDSLYGVYAKGQKIGITKLTPGVWNTTDGRDCTFTVHGDGSVTY